MTVDTEPQVGLAIVSGEGEPGAPRMAASGRLATAPSMAVGHCVLDDP